MIPFNNKKFKTREIFLSEFGNILISVTSLNNLLLSDNGAYISDEAMFVDEQIFFFVEDSEIQLPDAKLKQLVLSQIL